MESKKRREIDELEVFCKNVYFLRKKNGLTQREMAKLLNISVYSLGRIEKGIVPENLGCEMLFHLTVKFHVKMKELFEPLEKSEYKI